MCSRGFVHETDVEYVESRMADEAPIEQPPGNTARQFEFVADVEVIVHGDESRLRLARRIIEHREVISAKAIRLLESFMRDRGTFDLSSIEVFANETIKEGDFVLRYSFIANHDPHEYGYTYFDAFFLCHEPPQEQFWPFKFTVGFH